MQNKIIDENLINKVISGSVSHQREFVGIAEKIIYGALHSFNQLDNFEKKDMLQGIFLKLFQNDKRRIKMWNKKAKFSTYLYMISTNHALDYIDSKYYKQRLLSNGDFTIDSINHSSKRDPSEAIINEMTLDMCKNRLRPIEKEIIDLYFGKGLKEKEIAQHLNISINTISSIKNRAIKKIRKEIVQEF